MIHRIGNIIISVEVVLDLVVSGFVTLGFLELEDGLVDFVGWQKDVDRGES